MSAGWALLWPERPWTVNEDRASVDLRAKAARTAKWRGAFQLLAEEAKIPRQEAITITVIQYRRDRQGMPDVGSCFHAVKAGIDGLVDAGVIDEDGPRYVKRLVFEVPEVDPEIGDGLELIVRPWNPETPPETP